MVDRDTLEYYICDVGEDAAKSLFHLSDKQLETILYGKPVNNTRFTFVEKEYIPYERSTSPDLEQLERVITENYSKLYRIHVAKTKNINTRSQTQEDILQDGLLSILRHADSFTYTSDEETVRYINKALKHDRINAIQQSKVAQKHKAIFKDILPNQTVDEAYKGDAIANLFKSHCITSFQKDICNMLIEGFNQTEIAEKLGVTRKTVYSHIKKLQELVFI